MEIRADSMSEKYVYALNYTVVNYWFILSFSGKYTKTFY